MTTWTERTIEAGGGYAYNDVARAYNVSGTLYNYEDAPTTWSYPSKN